MSSTRDRRFPHANDADPTPLSDHPIGGRCRRPAACAASARRGGAARNDFRALVQELPASALPRRNMSPRSCCAPRASTRSPISMSREPRLQRGVRRWQGRFHGHLRASIVIRRSITGAPITILAGVHVGCFELFAREGIRSITDLKGKRSGCRWLSPHLLTVDGSPCRARPRKGHSAGSSIPTVKPIELFAEGKIDAFLGFPPEPQELRARHIGHVILNSAVDRPWSQYFCCMLAGNREYVRKYPVATKRVVRAILKAADLCAPSRRGLHKSLSIGGLTPRYDYAASGPERTALRQMARIRRRGHDPVLCACACTKPV